MQSPARLVLAVILTTIAATAAADDTLPASGTYRLDPPHTFVGFKAQHKVVGAVRGRFDQTTGFVVVSKSTAECSVDVSIDTASLSTQNSVRDADVKGPDFFDAAKFPAVTYRGKGIRRSGRGWVMDGVLTIRGIGRTVPLAFTFNGVAPTQAGQPERVGFHAPAAVPRAAFGMTRALLDEIGKRSKAPDRGWINAEELRERGGPER